MCTTLCYDAELSLKSVVVIPWGFTTKILFLGGEGISMEKMLKHRWVLLFIWIGVATAFLINQPNMKQILNQKGEATIPATEPSIIAKQMIDNMGKSKGDSVLLVFSDDKKLTENEMKDIENGINNLNNNKDKLHINNILDPFGTPDAKDNLISKDKTTLLAQVYFNKGDRYSTDIIDSFYNALKDVKVKHYLAGGFAIKTDYTKDTGIAVDKCTVITIIFILIVLLIMFRSVVVPVVTLSTVGISYLCAIGIIGALANKYNFPVTSFTQMFVVMVLFGIGTDYHILIFNRFKEEIVNQSSLDEAVIATYKSAGKTIIYCGLTILMAFTSLTFVKFPVYKSANAVAIGIAVLLIVIYTLTPLVMRILGPKLFWPSSGVEGHKESKRWDSVSSTSVKHPLLSLLAITIVFGAVIIENPTKLCFNTMKDLSTNDLSIKGFNLVEKKFSAGKVMQTTIVLKNKNAMDTNESLAIIDSLTEKLKGIKGIKEVYGPTQPKGAMIDSLYTNKQTKTVVDGLADANSGVKKVKDGLSTIEKNLPSTTDLSSVKKLSDGTASLQIGIDAVTDGMKKVDAGIDQGVDGTGKLVAGTEQLKTGVETINSGLRVVSSKLTEINKGYETLGQGYKMLPTYIGQLKQLTAAMQQSIARIDVKLPKDSDVASLKTMVDNLSKALDTFEASANTANSNYDTLTNGLAKVNDGLKTIIDSTSSKSKLVAGINDLENGEKALSAGLKKGSSGGQQVIASMQQLRNGVSKIKIGQDTLYKGLASLNGGMKQLKDGINKGNNGLTSIYDGIDKSSNFLTQLTSTRSFYIPKEANKADINKMLDMYMSKDRKTAKIVITLDSEPYSDASFDMVDNLKNIVGEYLKGTTLSDTKFGIAGASSESHDLRAMAIHDITFTQIIVLLTIFILLVVILKSFWIPVYIIATLMAAFYTALAATMQISKHLFSVASLGLAWNVPFFSFIMIAALGVDYSIFLMTRYKEYSELSRSEAIVIASRKVGGVVSSAAIILSGTFATLYPSNIVMLQELSICIVIGLFLLSFVLLPIGLPALISLTDKFQKKTPSKSTDTHTVSI